MQLLNNALQQTNSAIENPIEELSYIFSNIDISQVIEDIQPFIKNHTEVDKWSNAYFLDTLNRLINLEEPIV